MKSNNFQRLYSKETYKPLCFYIPKYLASLGLLNLLALNKRIHKEATKSVSDEMETCSVTK